MTLWLVLEVWCDFVAGPRGLVWPPPQARRGGTRDPVGVAADHHVFIGGGDFGDGGFCGSGVGGGVVGCASGGGGSW